MSARPRLLYASFDEIPSFKGASTHVLSVCRSLRRDFDLHLLTLGAQQLPARPGFTHHSLVLSEPNMLRRGERFRERVAQAIRSLQPDLAHFRSPWEGLPLIGAKIPTLYEINGLPSIELPQTYRVPESTLRILGIWERQCVQSATTLVSPSERIARCVRELYGAPRVHVLPNGFDRVARAATPPTGGPLRMVYLGTLHPWQGLFVALRALDLLCHEATLDILAPPHRDFTPHFERIVHRRGLQQRVRLLDPMHKGRLADVLGGYHVGLAPLTKSRRNVEQGCCPIKILDYLAHGLPVVASDLFVVRELLTHQHNALLVPPNDARALADALAQLAVNRPMLAALAARSRDSLRGRLDWNEHGARMRELHLAHANMRSSASSVRVHSSSALSSLETVA